MNSKAEEFLYILLWGAETLARPTFHNLNESFEGWAYRKGLHRRLSRLERNNLVEKKSEKITDRIYRLTEAGRLAALGGRDPQRHWNRPWDGRWRFVVFDLPERQNAARVRLRRLLKECGFGYLQKSLWITPNPLEKRIRKLALGGYDVESFVTLEGHPCSGERNEAIVTGAWDFAKINKRYGECISLLNEYPAFHRGKGRDLAKLQEWAGRERSAWHAAMKDDPLLPSVILPSGYLGKKAWRARSAGLRKAGRWLR